MTEVSEADDWKFGALPRGMLVPFWSEVCVHGVSALISAGVWIALDHGLPPATSLSLQTSYHWLPPATPILLLTWLTSPFGIPLFLNPLVRVSLRGSIRRMAKLERDPTPWWFKLVPVRWNASYARQHLPTWQFRAKHIYLAGIGRVWGAFIAYLATLVLASRWVEGAQMLLAIITQPIVLAIAIPFMLLGFFGQAFNNTLPETTGENRQE